MNNIIKEMKSALRSELSEWLGFDIPDEDDDDFETWTSRSAMIEDLSSFRDVYEYLGGDDQRAEEFFASFGINNFRLVI